MGLLEQQAMDRMQGELPGMDLDWVVDGPMRARDVFAMSEHGYSQDNADVRAVIDNLVAQPLKGLLLPFKGKGEVRKLRNQAEAELELLSQEAELLVEEFRRAYMGSRVYLPLGLTMHRAKRGYLRWRRLASSGGGQGYLDLLGVDGRSLLESMSSTHRAIYLAWEPRVRQWNFVSRLAVIRLCELEDLLASYELLDTAHY